MSIGHASRIPRLTGMVFTVLACGCGGAEHAPAFVGEWTLEGSILKFTADGHVSEIRPVPSPEERALRISELRPIAGTWAVRGDKIHIERGDKSDSVEFVWTINNDGDQLTLTPLIGSLPTASWTWTRQTPTGSTGRFPSVGIPAHRPAAQADVPVSAFRSQNSHPVLGN